MALLRRFCHFNGHMDHSVVVIIMIMVVVVVIVIHDATARDERLD